MGQRPHRQTGGADARSNDRSDLLEFCAALLENELEKSEGSKGDHPEQKRACHHYCEQ